MLRISIDPNHKVKALGDLFGLFFEDLNHAADGGLYAEMLQNRAFEFCELDNPAYHTLTAWEPVGHPTLEIRTDDAPESVNPHTLLITGERGEGVRNLGYSTGLALKSGAEYRFACVARAVSGTRVWVRLTAEGRTLAQAEIVLDAEWSKAEYTLVSDETSVNASLTLTLDSPGGFELDSVSLFPRDVFCGRENGLRRDIAEALAQMHPRFLRFPGGCLIHDGKLDRLARDGMYRWKNTVGELSKRPARRNSWRYNQTFGLGFFEFFCFCEDIGAKALPVVSGGCDPHHRRFAEGEELQDFINDALDLIEFANGGPDTRWGALRAEMGHPLPFGMEYIGIGNEEVHQAFFDRLPLFVSAVRERYPDMKIVGTAGPFAAGSEFERGWHAARETGCDIVDEHYYQSPEWFLRHADRYSAYPEEGPKVFLGEYASWGNTYENALIEAAYMTRMQNAPTVALACYAPMLAHVDYVNWRPDLLYYDNSRVLKTANYYTQKLFMQNQGEFSLSMRVEGAEMPLAENPLVRGDILLRANDSGFRVSGIVFSNADGRCEHPDVSLGEKDSVLLCTGEGDFELEFDARRVSGWKGFSVLFGHWDDQNCYQWGIGGWENQDCILNRRELGRGSCLTQAAFSVEDGHTYHCRLKVQGSHIMTEIDGKRMNDTTEPPLCPDRLYTAASVEGDEIILKAVNVREKPAQAQISLKGLEQAMLSCVVTELSGIPLDAENTLGEPEVISPSEHELPLQGTFDYIFPPQSVTILRLKRTDT